jgi:hypothetical protein
MHFQDALSTEFVRVSIGAVEDGLTIDPTLDSLEMAFPVTGVSPVSGDWKSASWETDVSTSPVTYFARALVGPTGVVTLTEGLLYDVYVRITDSPEIVVRNTGALAIL